MSAAANRLCRVALDEMDSKLLNIKKNIVRMASYSHASHVGSALSVADILFTIYTRVANIGKSNIESANRDCVILSKGHASSAMYSILAELDIIPSEWLDKYYIDGGALPGHLDMTISSAIDCSTGSLGHGVPIGVGMALANSRRNVYVIIGDGELNEGSNWESFLFCGAKKLNNLTFVIDYNNLQGFGAANEVADYSRLSAALCNIGLDACDVCGHNIEELEKSLKRGSDRTKALIAHTIKGNGVSYMENELKWHYKSPTSEELNKAYEDLTNAKNLH